MENKKNNITTMAVSTLIFFVSIFIGFFITIIFTSCNKKTFENPSTEIAETSTLTDAKTSTIDEKTTEGNKETAKVEKTEVTTEKAKTTEKEAAKDKTTATTTETSKPQTTQASATTQATTEAPKPQTTQAPVTTQATTEAPKPQTTQAPATTQANKPQTTQAPVTTQAPAKTEHQHSWESVGHTETVYVRSDTGGQVTADACVIHNGQWCIITGYTGGYECGVCGYRCTTGQEIDDHVWGVHNGEANTKDWQEPIYVSVTQKSIYVEDYQRCSTCGATK